jgi:flagellar basal body-associated protein FliL
LLKSYSWYLCTNTRTAKGGEAVEKARSLVVLLATLVVSITYQAGLDPPGGLWPDSRDGHEMGEPILLTTHPVRYKIFFYSNSAAFVASLIVIMMVQSRFLLQRHTLEAAMILDLFGLISAYAAGSCRDENTSIYVVAMAGIVLVYVVVHIIFFTLDHDDNHRDDADKLENRRQALLLLAILAATLTYQAGLTPPGGFLLENDSFGHRAGSTVLLDYYPRQFKAFFYCNAVSFMASVALIVLLVNPNLYRPAIRCYALYVCMVVGMFGLMGAYAAGSSRQLRTSIYVLTLVAAVLAFVALEVVIFWINPHLKKYLTQRRQKKPGDGSAKELPEQGGGIMDTREQGSSPSRDKDRREQDSSESSDKDRRGYLMLLGVLAASVTYQTGLKPPGGLWKDHSSGHYAGDPILRSINKGRYYAFFYSNSTSFMASIVVIFLLLPSTLHKQQIELPLWSIHTAVLLDMLGLLGAYAAGSTIDWETSRNVIYLVIPVLAYVAVYAAVSFFRKRSRCHKPKTEQQQPLGNDDKGGQNSEVA